jgi:hypothetical protein
LRFWLDKEWLVLMLFVRLASQNKRAIACVSNTVAWERGGQLKELRRLQKENERLRSAVSDMTLDKLILTEASRGN